MRPLWIPVLMVGAMLPAQIPVLGQPAGWRKERLDFPLDFAPLLPFKGYEDIRFMPGMFKPETKDYFSYAFVWWLQGFPTFTAKGLETQLRGYFQGLAESVGKGKSLSIPMNATRVRVIGHRAPIFDAEVRTVDAFNGARPLDLRIQITVQKRPTEGSTAIFFAVAPTGVDPVIRQGLQALVGECIGAGFKK